MTEKRPYLSAWWDRWKRTGWRRPLYLRLTWEGRDERESARRWAATAGRRPSTDEVAALRRRMDGKGS